MEPGTNMQEVLPLVKGLEQETQVPSTVPQPSATKARRNQKLAATTGHAPLKFMAMVEIKIFQTLSEKSYHAETQPDRILNVALHIQVSHVLKRFLAR